MAIPPGGGILDDRERLLSMVAQALDLVDRGATAKAAESEWIDFKEEAGRRDRLGFILPGQSRSHAVAEQLANEVACLANSPGGGALIVGVADDGTRVPAASDAQWLRLRIHQRVDLAPAVEERQLADGTRVLVILVLPAREPVPDVQGRIRWRIGANCLPVDRSQWWANRLAQQGVDQLAARTRRTVADLAPGALAAVRRLLREHDPHALGGLPERELLTRVGVLLPDGTLTGVGVLFLCAAPRTVLEFAVHDLPGGNVIAPAVDLSGLSLAEQLAEVQTRIEAVDTAHIVESGFRRIPVRQIPWAAVREAILNAIVHRDWLPPEPIQLTWVRADSSLDVVSPGGFSGGVTAHSILSGRYSRNPALADFVRALGLVEKQGVGMDRMYAEMLALGHRAPLVHERPGPQVRTRLVGGAPLPLVLAVLAGVEPAARQTDTRVVMTLHLLLRFGFTCASAVAAFLQVPMEEADEILLSIAEMQLGGHNLLRDFGEGRWLPGPGFFALLPPDLTEARRRRLLRWLRPDELAAAELVQAWTSAFGRVTSSDLAEVTHLPPPAARGILQRLAADGVVRRGPTLRGRKVSYLPGESLE
ncbi:MAG: ATP-binding protein [Angustibacter sp.]